MKDKINAIRGTLAKLSSPVARTALAGISILLLIDAIMTIYFSIRYPYLINRNYPTLYADDSSSLVRVYCGISALSIIVALSTAIAAYNKTTNYTIFHGGIIGCIFVPLSITFYFIGSSSRYKVHDQFDIEVIKNYNPDASKLKELKPAIKNELLKHLDEIQREEECCGSKTPDDWINEYQGFLPGSCCSNPLKSENPAWASKFELEDNFKFDYCERTDFEGCHSMMKDDEEHKMNGLHELVVFMIVMCISNTIASLILFALNKSENSVHDCTELHELPETGASNDGDPVGEGGSIKPRTSVASNHEALAIRAQIVRFNLANSPRHSISGPSKFSAAARRGSSFI